ncbi:BatA domain-containing protein [Lacinutrix sp. MedPE-SW]|uniref:BatA domain-containing protein n=1 Tax=Lacinutrix sp. MedPE-SW TaxID=1860087 RepID=UPI00345B83CB
MSNSKLAMQFKNPELLYALFLLLIPVLIHLFQLRKFQKESFTNVAFLKKVTLQTRKSSQIKKWLVLCLRMLLLAAIIFAFAQPYISKNKTFNAKTETVIYLDNSYSMQAKGDKGELLKRAVNDIIENVGETETLSIITNNDAFRNTTIKAITNDLLSLNYSSNQLSYDAALLKSKKYFTKNENTIKNLLFISDFQQKNQNLNLNDNLDINLNLVQLQPVNTTNVTVDSLYISKQNASNLELTAVIKNNGNTIENLPVSLFNNQNLLTKSAVTITDKATAVFTLPNNQIINGQVSIDDTNLQFDNTLYFNINRSTKLNVLTVNQTNDSFLKRIYTAPEFNYTSTTFNTLNYSDISKQNLIVLNELEQIPGALNTALKSFTNNGGIVIVIPPATTIDLASYNTILNNFGLSKISSNNITEKKLTTINYSHPIFNSVFEKKVSNFQYPKVNSFYAQNVTTSPLLQYEDGKPFLSENNGLYFFTAALNTKNSNFTNINLVVPTFYNISQQSLKRSNLYYTIGKENKFDVVTNLQQDAVLTLQKGEHKIIPQQQYFNNKVTITTNETPELAGIYTIKNKTEILENVSYNYSRDESVLNYQQFSNNDNVTVSNSVSQTFNNIKSDNNVNALWKWFVIFALLLLITEMLILKYFK